MAKEQNGLRQQQTIGQRMWRKQLILPAEHGSWAWLLIPYAVGVVMSGGPSLAAGLIFLGGFSAFLLRQPATIWLRIQRGRARRRDAYPALAWITVLGTAMLASLFGLLLMRRTAVLWLLLPIAAVFAFYLLGSRQGRAGLRTLWMELSGAVALAGMAPAVLAADAGILSLRVWMVWLLLGLQNGLGAVYVRLRIADTHERPSQRKNIIMWHGGGLLIVSAVAFGGWVPAGVIIFYVGLLLRAVWAAQQKRPVTNVKRFGFVEMSVEIVGGIWLVVMYYLWAG